MTTVTNKYDGSNKLVTEWHMMAITEIFDKPIKAWNINLNGERDRTYGNRKINGKEERPGVPQFEVAFNANEVFSVRPRGFEVDEGDALEAWEAQ